MANFLVNIGNNLQTHLDSNAKLAEFTQRFQDLQGKLPNLISHLKDLKVNYFELRKRVSQRLKRQGKKHKLALEFLGWGTISDFLASAFCGDILDVWS